MFHRIEAVEIVSGPVVLGDDPAVVSLDVVRVVWFDGGHRQEAECAHLVRFLGGEVVALGVFDLWESHIIREALVQDGMVREVR